MGLNLIGGTPDNVNAVTVRFPAGDAGSKMLIGIGQAAIVFFANGIDWGFRFGIAIAPENFLKLLALLLGANFQDGPRLPASDNLRDFVQHPVRAIAIHLL